MKCLECGGETKPVRGRIYDYTESGLSNIRLVGLTIRVCQACKAEYPQLPAIQKLHDGIAKQILFRQESLRGEEVRFLRKEMGIKAKDFADRLGVTKVAVSRWEHSKKALPAITDRLIRCVFLLHWLKRNPPSDDIRTFLQQFEGGLADIRRQLPSKPREMNVGSMLVPA